MSLTPAALASRPQPLARTVWIVALLTILCAPAERISAQSPAQVPSDPAAAVEKPLPGLDLSSMDLSVDPCEDMYKYACGNFTQNHPIPADQANIDPFNILFNVNTQALSGILTRAAAATPSGTSDPDARKIGDFYNACMDTSAIETRGLDGLKPLLAEIDDLGSTQMGKLKLAPLLGRLQRYGVDVLFGYGEQQDLKDATKQIATIGPGGLGMPEKDYYLRTGAADIKLREQYVAHVAKMLVLAGSSPEQANKDAAGIMALETELARSSLGVVDLRDPEKTYHLEPIATFQARIQGVNFNSFEDAIHSPHVTEINDATPSYWPDLLKEVKAVDMATLKAYLRYHLLSAVAGRLPKRFDDENFDFTGRILNGQPEQKARWKRCSSAVDNALGEALGKLYVAQYFAGDSKAQTLQMVHDIEAAMGHDIDQIDWMSPATRIRAHEKLATVANKIGYPDKWRDYSALEVRPGDALGNLLRATAFENDRELAKIGKPIDRLEWGMTPPTVNAYYDDSMNDINFPAGILQPPFYGLSQDLAVNYGHIGAIIGHELTHGFDDEGRKFDAHGNLSNWWTPDDIKNFEARTDCLVKEYGSFLAIDDVKVNGKLTLGENTADNGGLLLAYMAYMQRARENHLDLAAKQDNFTGPQRFYIAYAQNYCEDTRPEAVRSQVLQDPHSPDQFRVNGVLVNQPGFAGAFSCKKGTPMAPVDSCRVW